MKTNHMARAEAIFRRMLRKGMPIALEDAVKGIKTPEGVDRRCFGYIPVKLRRDGLITEAGFRLSVLSRAHQCPKRLWVLTDSTSEGKQ